ncbi:Mov34/MPN/PAD-1 family protein [Erysipelothrix anatis]|uniref:Mov34/MPN/PAD-1 family protein n=1 Tax=Erysipelothrix anatis TaxID=2683713 RepID=UPI00140E56B9|nr:Mov34/MPN/PAD-1 family protein [Erysipelothrix anatis]
MEKSRTVEISTINVGEGARNTFSKFSQKTTEYNKEYGGILLGRVSEDGEVFIEIATEPNVWDISNYLSFVRRKDPSQYIINRIWKKSKGIINYLGEWHTHPFDSNKPSNGDLRMIDEALNHNFLCFGFMLMIIVDTKNEFSITIANKKEIITKENCHNEKLHNKL